MFSIHATRTADSIRRSTSLIPVHATARLRGEAVSPGGDVFMHGLPNGFGYVGPAHRLRDWTDGCIAVTNPEIDEIWAVVADGTPIEIRP